MRAQVAEALAKLKHGFCLIHSLMQARKASENFLADYAASLVNICLKALQLEIITLNPTDGFSAFSVSTVLIIQHMAAHLTDSIVFLNVRSWAIFAPNDSDQLVCHSPCAFYVVWKPKLSRRT